MSAQQHGTGVCALSGCSSNKVDAVLDDVDGDGVGDAMDNCPEQSNPGQLIVVGDDTLLGDSCDDEDRDSIVDAQDNCPLMSNAAQMDTDGNGLGDVCEYCEAVALVADIWPGTGSSSPGFLVPVAGKLYFPAADPLAGIELRVLDPADTEAGIALVDDIRPGERWSLPTHLTEFDDRLYLTASDGVNGIQLRVFDPALPAAGAAPVPGYDQRPAPEIPADLAVLDGRLYLSASDSVYGRELWVHDPQNPTVAADRVADLYPGSEGGWPDNLVALDEKLYFAAFDAMAADGLGDDVLWVYDPGDPSGPRPVVTGNDARSPSDLFVFDGRLYFAVTFPGFTRELASYDPAAPDAGITLVDDIAPGVSVPIEFVELDGRLYFRLINVPLERAEVWVFDPDLGVSPVFDDKDPDFLAALDGKLYVSAYDAEFGNTLWMHDPDGAVGNATLVHDRRSSYVSAFEGKLYFSGYDELYGQELLVHDPACRR